jgi:hypothetical protein
MTLEDAPVTTVDPRDQLAARRRRFDAPPDAMRAAMRLELAADAMRARVTPEPEPQPFVDEVTEPAAVVAVAEVLREWDAARKAPAPAVTPPVQPADDRDRRDLHMHGPGFDGFCDVCGVPEADRPLTAAAGEGRRLTWRANHDPRSREFGARARGVIPGRLPLQPVRLPVGPIFDQGREGACFGMAAAAAVNVMRLTRNRDADPSELLTATDAVELYHAAQRLDEFPGEDYSGTSVTGGMRALVAAGVGVGGYVWDFGTADIAQTLLAGRPVIVGIPWASGMYDTGPRGKVIVTGTDEGLGHVLCLVGLELTGPNGEPGVHFTWQNSWGTGYGDEGLGHIAHADLAERLHGWGEAAVPTTEAQQ